MPRDPIGSLKEASSHILLCQKSKNKKKESGRNGREEYDWLPRGIVVINTTFPIHQSKLQVAMKSKWQTGDPAGLTTLCQASGKSKLMNLSLKLF